MTRSENKHLISTLPAVMQRGNQDSDSRSGLSVVLFTLVSLFLLALLYVGTTSYFGINNDRETADDERLGLSLLANSVRMNDVADAVGVAEGPEGNALVLTEHTSTADYETRIYLYNGSILQEYTRAGSAFSPDSAREVVESSTFQFAYADGMLALTTDQGSTVVALRCAEGDA